MIEEMRHGWQMCALLVDHFGYSGKVEAQKMLERRAFENKRLLGAFNVDVDNWMDFFTYTDFVDRDGKFQLQMFKYSAFAPLGRSMSYMLREEAFHMGTGNDGLRRIVEAGVVPGWLIQKYLNKWISSSYDLSARITLHPPIGPMYGGSRGDMTSRRMSRRRTSTT